MIATDVLIRQLAADTRIQRKGIASLRLAGAIIAGALISLAGLALWLGQPLAAVAHTGVPAFTMKIGYALSVAGLSGMVLLASGRPGIPIGKRMAWLFLPLALVAGAAIMEIAMTAPQFRDDIWLGSTWATCLLAIVGFSVPVFAGIAWAFRRLAPTRLALTGFLAGVTSGAAAAVVYGLYCPETTATFLASWYTAGILASGFIGWIAGPRLFRW